MKMFGKKVAPRLGHTQVVGHCPHCGYEVHSEDLEVFKAGSDAALMGCHFCCVCQQPFTRLAEEAPEEPRRQNPSRPTGGNFVNLTPHALVVRGVEQDSGREVEVTLPPVTPAVRVASTWKPQGSYMLHSGFTSNSDAIELPVGESQFGKVENLPPPQEGTVYIVSLVALQAIKEQHPERKDVLAPDTGPDSGAIRQDGKVVAVVRMLC